MELNMETDFLPETWFWRSTRGADGDGHFVPRADVVEDAEGYHFYFEMAGLAPESVDVRVEDDQLVIEGVRNHPQWAKDAKVLRAERSYGKIHRAFELPDDASHEGIRASYKEGVLTVMMPKRPETKPVKVTVQYDN